MYAQVVNGVIVRAMIALPPELVGQPVAVQEAAGYFLITDPGRPADDPASRIFWDPTITLVAGRPVVVWSQRAPQPTDIRRTVIAANRQIALDLAAFMADVAEIKSFLADPDIQRVLDQPNNTDLATSDLNRALKAIVREERRLANLAVRMAKVIVSEDHPEVLEASI